MAHIVGKPDALLPIEQILLLHLEPQSGADQMLFISRPAVYPNGQTSEAHLFASPYSHLEAYL